MVGSHALPIALVVVVLELVERNFGVFFGGGALLNAHG
jgi:hypothetical protein